MKTIGLALFLILAGTSCTAVKPITGLVTGPIVLGEEARRPDARHPDGGHPITVAVSTIGGIFAGPVVGLFTGLVSDWHAVTGETDEVTRNWDDPFRHNADPRRPPVEPRDARDRAPPTSNPPGYGR